MRTLPNRDEYELTDKGWMHTPTGYSFTRHPGSFESGNAREGKLGSVLDDGRDYRPHEVTEMGWKLWRDYIAENKLKP